MEQNPWSFFFKEELSQEIERCLRHSSELQVNKSRKAGYGAWCLEKRGWKKKTPYFMPHIWSFVSFLAREPPVGQSLLIHQVSRSHTTTHHSR